MSSLTVWVLVILGIGGAILSGSLLHEAWHYCSGWWFGASPFVSETWLWNIPREIDFQTPEIMTDRQVQIAGGGVLAFPTAFFLFSVHLLVSNPPESQWIFFGKALLFLLFLSGSSLSWLDLLALREPDLWRQYTAGEPIQRHR